MDERKRVLILFPGELRDFPKRTAQFKGLLTRGSRLMGILTQQRALVN